MEALGLPARQTLERMQTMHKIILSGPRYGGRADKEKFAVAVVSCRVRFPGIGAEDIWNPATLPEDMEPARYRRRCCEAVLDAGTQGETAMLVRLKGWNRDTSSVAEWALARDCGMLVLDQWWA